MKAIRHFIRTFALTELLQGLALTLRVMFRKKPTVRVGFVSQRNITN